MQRVISFKPTAAASRDCLAFSQPRLLSGSSLCQLRAPAARRLSRKSAVCAAQDDSRQDAAVRAPLAELKRRSTQLFQKYDFVSAGLGALAVTTFCVARGQDAGTALWITAASTIVALLVNDLCFDD